MAADPKTRIGVLAALAVLTLAGALRGPTQTDGAGGDVATAASLQAARAPQRIASLVPALTEMLFAIGAGSQVIAVSSYDHFPAEVRALPKVGALLNPDYERIFQLKPTLVITYGSQTDLEARFTRAGIRSYSYRHGGLDRVMQTIRDLGELTGHQAQAAQVARQLQAELDAVRAKVRGAGRPRTMLVFERDPQALRQVYASGGRGFLDEIMNVAGATNVFADVDRESVQPSTETLLARAPEVIMEVRAGEPPAGGILARERAVWAPLASIPAVRNNRIYFLYGDFMVLPSTRLGRAAEAMARVLHPEVYR